MKHKHYDLIIAKAANFDLVQFIKLGDRWEIVGGHDNHVVNFGDHYQYFLCLPQHKEACLHWLNGGEVQVMDSNWVNMFPIENYPWEGEHDFMDDEANIRIKPKKEKRWIAYSTNQKRLGCLSFDSEQEARAHYIHEVEEPQFIEIEVEV